MKCIVCKKEVKTKRRKYPNDKLFCSKKCKDKYIYKIRSSERYKEWRRKVLSRDKYKCQRCKKKFKKSELNAHHITPLYRDVTKAFSLKNGVALCESCHKKVHRRLIRYILHGR